MPYAVGLFLTHYFAGQIWFLYWNTATVSILQVRKTAAWGVSYVTDLSHWHSGRGSYISGYLSYLSPFSSLSLWAVFCCCCWFCFFSQGLTM
jgi:hypothetical protein